MLKITENKDEIIVREFPFMRWLSALSAAVFFFLPVIFVLSLDKEFSRGQWFWLCFLLALFCFFLFLALAIPLTTIKLNNSKQTISVRRRSLVKYSFNVYFFNEAADLIYINETVGTFVKKKYQLLLPLKDGRIIELSQSVIFDEGQYFNAADLLNNSVFNVQAQIPLKLTVFNDE